MRELLCATVGQAGRQPTEYVGLACFKKLFLRALGDFARISRTPQLETTVEAVHLAESLTCQVGRRALT